MAEPLADGILPGVAERGIADVVRQAGSGNDGTEIARFNVLQAVPGDDPQGHSVDLAPLFGEALPEGVPRWLEVRKVTHKIDQRIEALRQGESPEALKLGRELSSSACIRLLRELEASLEIYAQQSSTEIGEIELAFGADYAYAAFTGEMLVASGALDAGSATLAHQRVAMFGFDRVSTMPTAGGHGASHPA